MAILLFYKMAAVRHIAFVKVRNFKCPYDSEYQYSSWCQIVCTWLKPLPIYGHYSIFKDGGRPPSWIS